MKNKKRILLSVAFIAVIIILVWQKKPKEVSVTSHAVQIEEVGPGQYLRQSRDFKAEIANKSEISSDFSVACNNFFDQLEQLNLGNTPGAAQMSYQLLPQKPDACVWKDGFLDQSLVDFQKDCIEKPSEEKQNLSSELSPLCYQRLFFLRAGITRILLKNKAISDITDLHQLVDLLFSEFAAGAHGETPDFTQMKAAAERMLELNPQLYVAAKTSLYAGAIEGLVNAQKNDPNVASFDWKKSEAELARAERLRPNDPSLNDARSVIATHGLEPEKTLAYAEEQIRRNPNDGKNYFLKGYAEWKMNRRTESIADLKRAIALSPEQKDFQKTLVDIQKPDANLESYHGSFNFAVDSGDFAG